MMIIHAIFEVTIAGAVTTNLFEWPTSNYAQQKGRHEGGGLITPMKICEQFEIADL